MKIEKIDPITCSLCESVEIFIYKKDKCLACNSCNTIVLSDGSSIPKDKEYMPRGYDPKFDTGDYIEGTTGVHEYSGSFGNRVL